MGTEREVGVRHHYNIVRQHQATLDALHDAPELNASFSIDSSTPSELYSSLGKKRDAIVRLGLTESIGRLFRGASDDQGSMPTQTIRGVILLASLRMPKMSVQLMKLGVNPGFAVDTYIEHNITDPAIYALLMSGTPLDWALKIVTERELDRNDTD